MHRKSYDTVTEAMTALKKLGYTTDFSLMTEKECIICHETKTELSPDDFKIDENRDGFTDYSFENPDFSYVQFNSNLVLRWEYIPGSELFLVWSQGVTSSVGSSNGLFEGFETGILDERPQNIFLLKATYRFIL